MKATRKLTIDATNVLLNEVGVLRAEANRLDRDGVKGEYLDGIRNVANRLETMALHREVK